MTQPDLQNSATLAAHIEHSGQTYDFDGAPHILGGYVSINYREKASFMRKLRLLSETSGVYLRALGLFEQLILSLEWESCFCSKNAADLRRDNLGAHDIVFKSIRLLEEAGAIKRVKHGGMKRITVSPRLAYWGNPKDIEAAVERCDRHFPDS